MAVTGRVMSAGYIPRDLADTTDTPLLPLQLLKILIGKIVRHRTNKKQPPDFCWFRERYRRKINCRLKIAEFWASSAEL